MTSSSRVRDAVAVHRARCWTGPQCDLYSNEDLIAADQPRPFTVWREVVPGTPPQPPMRTTFDVPAGQLRLIDRTEETPK